MGVKVEALRPSGLLFAALDTMRLTYAMRIMYVS